MTPALDRLKRWILCLVLVVALLAVWAAPKFWSAPRPVSVPYGVVYIPGTEFFGTQDFAYNLNYLRQIRDKTVEHPYRMEDQERMVKAWLPRASMGMLHAYSPVALVVAWPLLAMPVEWAFAFFTFSNAVLLVLLTAFYLLPGIKNSTQAAAVLAGFCGYVLLDTFNMGQTSLATTCILAVGFVLLQGRATLGRDVRLGLLLFVLCAKPSVAIVLVALLLGEKIWRALLIAALGLALTWLCLAPYYGGYVSGLQDYSWLLSHYAKEDAIPFMKPGANPAISTSFSSYLTALWPDDNRKIFQVSRYLFEGLILVLIVARWRKAITLSHQWQGLLWTFLLFSPYLLVTEDFAICLLVLEGNFFRSGPGAPLKVLLVFLLVNTCMGRWTQVPYFFPVKLALAGWWLLDQIVLPRVKGSNAARTA